MNRSQALKLLKGLSSKDYDIKVDIYLKSGANYKWLFNFKSGGFNSVWAPSRSDAYRIATNKFPKLSPVRDSFRKATQETSDAQDRAGWSMSM